MNPIVRLVALAGDLLAALAALVGSSPGSHVRTAPAPVTVPVPVEPRSRIRPYVPLPTTPIVPAHPVRPRVALVRPYLVDAERRRHQQRQDRDRLGLAVLMDLADLVEVPA